MRIQIRLSALLLLLCLLAGSAFTEQASSEVPFDFRFPGPAEWTEEERSQVLRDGSMSRSSVLDFALTLLEEGNPFLERYNLLTGAEVTPRFSFGVPYLFGGQAANHVFAKAPDYVVQKAWRNSPIWYKKNRLYLYGFDCVGYVNWVWKKTKGYGWPGTDMALLRRSYHVFDEQAPLPSWPEVAEALVPGDIFIRRNPNTHTGFYLGTLRQFGYTAETVPELAEYLDYPLVLHTSNNASIAARFQWLIDHGLPKYHAATVTDGGVMVSLLGPEPETAPEHVVAQLQDTWYYTLPDGTWLSVMPWKNIEHFCFYRFGDRQEPNITIER